MSNELRWVRHLHSLPVFFRREGSAGRARRKGGVERGGGLKENKCEMKAFLEATKSCTLEKDWGALNGAEEHTDKCWEGRRHALQWHRAPCLVQRASKKYRKRKRVKDRMKMMDLLGSIVDVAAGERGWYICWAKGHRVFSAIHLKTNRAAQAGAVKLHLVVEWILSCSPNKKGPTMLHVWPYAKSQDRRDGDKEWSWSKKGEISREVGKQGKTNEENLWEKSKSEKRICC